MVISKIERAINVPNSAMDRGSGKSSYRVYKKEKKILTKSNFRLQITSTLTAFKFPKHK